MATRITIIITHRSVNDVTKDYIMLRNSSMALDCIDIDYDMSSNSKYSFRYFTHYNSDQLIWKMHMYTRIYYSIYSIYIYIYIYIYI